MDDATEPEVLLTGATGFVGSAVLHLLRSSGRPVAALVRTEAASAHVSALGARPLLGDLVAPTPEIEDAIREARYVVHCAQPTGRGERGRMDGNLIRALDPGHVARMVYVCGSSYLGRAQAGELLDERTPPRIVVW